MHDTDDFMSSFVDFMSDHDVVMHERVDFMHDFVDVM